MQQLYSTVGGAEIRPGLAKVLSLAGFVQARAKATENRPSGDAEGDAGRGRVSGMVAQLCGMNSVVECQLPKAS